MSPAPAEGEGNFAAGRGARLPILQGIVLATGLTWALQVVSFLDAKEAALWLGVLALWAATLIAGHWPRDGFRALLPGWIALALITPLGAFLGGVPAPSLLEGLRLAALLAVATFAWDLLQRSDGQRGLFRAIILTATLAAALALAQRAGFLPGLFPAFPHYDQTMYSVFGNQGLLAGYLAVALVLLPGELSAPRHRLPCLAAGLLMATALVLTGSRGGLLALAAGLLTRAVLDRADRRPSLSVLALVTLPGLVLAFGLETPPWARWFNGDTELRPWIWRATAALAFDQFPWGAGLGHYARAVPNYLGEAATGTEIAFNELRTEHAHFDLLEWLAETGLPGLLGLIALFWRVRPGRPTPFSALIAGLVFSCLHPAFHSAPHALVGLLLFVACQSPTPARPGPSPGAARIRLALAGLPLLCGAAAFVTLELRPSVLLARAEALHLAGAPAQSAYEAAVNAPGFHPEAHESYGILLLEQGDNARALEQFEIARIGLESGRIYRLLALAAEGTGDYEAACRWNRECVARWPWNEDVRKRIHVRCSGE